MIFGSNFSHLIFEAVNFWGFWGLSEMRGNDFEENKVVPLIVEATWASLIGWPHKTSNSTVQITIVVSHETKADWRAC